MASRVLNILVADDEPDLIEFIKETTTSYGHKVFTAGDGKAALNHLASMDKNGKIDLVISDVRMPGVGGLEVLNECKDKNIAIILMTGFAGDLDFKKAEELGASDFLKKPFGLDELKNSIELIIHQLDKQGETQPVDLDHEYCQVPIDQFLSGSLAVQDIFLRLSNEKYLRIARASSPLSMDRIKSYKSKGLAYLCIKKEDFATYVGFNVKLARAASSGKFKISTQDKLNLVRQSGEAYIQNVFVNGIKKADFNDGRMLVETALQLLTESDNVYELLEMLRKHSSVIFSHSLGVSLYAGLVAKQLGWSNPTTQFKVSLAGIMHDIGKKEIPAALLTKDRFEMSAEEITVYETHPSRGRDLLLTMPFISEEIVQAVAQHHEDMKGMGFPFRLPRAKIHVIAKLIFVVNDFCHWCLSGPMGKGLDPKEAFDRMFSSKSEDYDLEMLKALMTVLNYPIPEKLKNLKAKVGV